VQIAYTSICFVILLQHVRGPRLFLEIKLDVIVCLNYDVCNQRVEGVCQELRHLPLDNYGCSGNASTDDVEIHFQIFTL
jgi:hypothetical protein